MASSNKRVTGIGGIFFKTKNPEAMKNWYEKHLGLVKDEYGSIFEVRNTDNTEQKNYTVWSPFKRRHKIL